MLDKTHQKTQTLIEFEWKRYNGEVSGEPFTQPMKHGQVVE